MLRAYLFFISCFMRLKNNLFSHPIPGYKSANNNISKDSDLNKRSDSHYQPQIESKPTTSKSEEFKKCSSESQRAGIGAVKKQIEEIKSGIEKQKIQVEEIKSKFENEKTRQDETYRNLTGIIKSLPKIRVKENKQITKAHGIEHNALPLCSNAKSPKVKIGDIFLFPFFSKSNKAVGDGNQEFTNVCKKHGLKKM